MEKSKGIIIADVHGGNAFFDQEKFEDLIWQTEAEKWWALVLGDAFQMQLKTSKGSPSDQIWSAEATHKYLYKWFGKIAHLIELFIDGNHEDRLLREGGYSPTLRLADALGLTAKYSHGTGWVKVCTENEKKIGYTIHARHGSGGGQLPGSELAMVSKAQQQAVADVYIAAHMHRGAFSAPGEMEMPDMRNNTVERRPYWYLAAPSLQVSWGSYADNGGRRMMQTRQALLSMDMRKGHRNVEAQFI